MKTTGYALLLTALCAGTSMADTLRLQNGQSIEGTLLRADTRTVQFLGADGAPLTINISEIAAIEFGAGVQVQPAPVIQQPAAQPLVVTDGVTVPDGTTVTVRMIDNIDSEQTAPGERFRCSVDDPVVVDNRVVIPRDANCTVQVTAVEASDELALRLYDVAVNGQSYDTVTEYAQVEAEGQSRGSTAARRGIAGGALGAGLGALIGGGEGAAIGAAAGAGIGALSAAKARGKQLVIPAETRLQFELRTPLPLG